VYSPDVQEAPVRIGELSRRTGVGVELLRAWERRYGLLRPARSAGGFRLYTPSDERRVRRMQEHLSGGLAAAEAARAAIAEVEDAPPARRDAALLETERGRLVSALDSLDETLAHAALDALLAAFTVPTVLAEVVLPYLADIGARWERGEASVAQEHFASNLLRGRLLAIARAWDRGAGPRALLACAPGDLHDLPLIVFGLALADRGWRISFLGPDTPVDSIADAGAVLRPDAVVVAATTGERLEPVADELRRIARTTRLYLAGRGVRPGLADRIGATQLAGDPVGAASELDY
jgi:MerR family transcriptional regulator, light-induced transcriptional regulator